MQNYFSQESARLKYRKLTESDISSWVEFFDNNDRLEYLGMDLQKSKEVLATEWIKIQLDRYHNHGLGHLAVELKDSGELIGMGGILPREIDSKQEYEIAYSLKPKYWAKGYATEMAKTMRTFGFENIKTPRLISIIHEENADSIKVAVKNGMKPLFKMEFLDMPVEVYGILK